MKNNIEAAIKNFNIKQNVSFRVIDKITGQVVQEVKGHNAATNSMLQGIAHYLVGDGVLNQAGYTLRRYIPMYISLGTMGLYSQEADERGLPVGIGGTIDVDHSTVDATKAAMEAAAKTLDDAALCQHGELDDTGRIICRCYLNHEDYVLVDSEAEEPIDWPTTYNTDYYVYNEQFDTYYKNEEVDWNAAKQIPIYHYETVGPFNCKICTNPNRRQKILDALDLYDQAVAAYEAAVKAYNDAVSEQQAKLYTSYMNEAPGYGADGYDMSSNNNRQWFGLGPLFANRPGDLRDIRRPTINCELINAKFPRAKISFRQIIPEIQAELPETVDIIFSAMISTGALAQFREKDKNYIFISEAGLWSKPDFVSGGDNGLLAGYRLAPPDDENWDMYIPENRELLQRSILRVGLNQVVQVIWKIQIGALGQFINIEPNKKLYFTNIEVLQSSWIATTAEDKIRVGLVYEYKYNLSTPNVTGDMLPRVIFNTREILSGNFADMCDSWQDDNRNGFITIYAKTIYQDFIIPTVYAEEQNDWNN